MTATVKTTVKTAVKTMVCHPEVVEATCEALDLPGGASLATDLYQWYVNRTPVADEPSRRCGAIDLTPATALRAAHAGSRSFDPGWTVVERTGLATCRAAHRDGHERWVQAGEFRTDGGSPPQPGAQIRVERAWTWVEPETGFWLTRNGAWTPAGADELARVYVNVTPRQALELVRGLTGHFLAENTSFVMKTSAVAEPTGRADALVLYLGMPDWQRHRAAIIAIASARSGWLRTATPRFAEVLGPGLAWGVGRLDGESFGKLRCDTIAEVVNEHRDAALGAGDRADEGEIVEAVVRRLREVGVDPAAPHRHTGV